jgi:hypothetical protein
MRKETTDIGLKINQGLERSTEERKEKKRKSSMKNLMGISL